MSCYSECLHLCSNGFLVYSYPSSPIISEWIKSHYSIKVSSKRHFDHTVLLIEVYTFLKTFFFSEVDRGTLKQEKNNSSVNPATSVSSTAVEVFMEEQGEGIATFLYNCRKTYAGLRLVDIIQISCLCKVLA